MKNDEKRAKEKYLYKCESYVDVDEYLKMAEYFPVYNYIPFLTRGFLLNLIVSLFISLLMRDWYITLLLFIIFQVIIAVYCKKAQKSMLRKLFINNNSERKYNYSFLFYKEHILYKMNKDVVEIKYEMIKEIIENETNIYLSLNKTNQILIIQKGNCSSKLIDFLREKFNNLDKSKSQKHIMIELFLYSLLLLTLVTIPIAMHTYDLLSNVNYLGDNPFWIVLLFLIIPLSSIVLGIYYNSRGVSSRTVTATITIGFIVFILLLFFSIGLLSY